MIDNLKEFWYLWLIVVVLLVIAVFAMKKASAAVKKHNETMRSRDEELKRLKYLVDNYSSVTPESAQKADPCELIDGMAAVLQRKLEKRGDFNGEFESASVLEKKMYACHYFFEDVKDGKLSDWCRNNGEPLISLTLELISDIGENKLLSVMKKMYPMFDKNDDVTSYDESRIKELNSDFSKIYSKERIAGEVRDFVVSSFSEKIELN